MKFNFDLLKPVHLIYASRLVFKRNYIEDAVMVYDKYKNNVFYI